MRSIANADWMDHKPEPSLPVVFILHRSSTPPCSTFFSVKQTLHLHVNNFTHISKTLSLFLSSLLAWMDELLPELVQPAASGEMNSARINCRTTELTPVYKTQGHIGLKQLPTYILHPKMTAHAPNHALAPCTGGLFELIRPGPEFSVRRTCMSAA